MKKILIAYYSLSGRTRKIVEQVEKTLEECEVEEIKDLNARRGIIGFIRNGRRAMKEKQTDIITSEKNPSEYDLVILASPVWAANMTPAIRTYMERYKDKIKASAFILTCGSSGDDKALEKMENIVGTPVDTVTFSAKELKQETAQKKINKFIEKITA